MAAEVLDPTGIALEAGPYQAAAPYPYPRLRQAFLDATWLLRPEKIEALAEVLILRLQGGRYDDAQAAERVAAWRREHVLERPLPVAADDGGGDGEGGPFQLVVPEPIDRLGTVRVGGVAVVPVVGTIVHRPSMFASASGGVSTMEIAGAFRRALSDPQVQAVVLDVDSPGGHADGTAELAAEILAARGGGKPIVAVANTEMASAAYWIGSAADQVVASPSSLVGSIGAYAVHEDLSGLYAAEGVVPTVIKAGRFKAEEGPWSPLSDDARASIQQRVDAIYQQFVRAVARGRGVSVERVRGRDFGEGRVMAAEAAVANGLADRIGTLEATVRRLTTAAGRRAVLAKTLPEPAGNQGGETAGTGTRAAEGAGAPGGLLSGGRPPGVRLPAAVPGAGAAVSAPAAPATDTTARRRVVAGNPFIMAGVPLGAYRRRAQ